MSTKTEDDFLYLAHDIEKAGKSLDDALLMIGTCLGEPNGVVIETKAFCFPIPPKEEFEPRCWNEFWSKPEMKLVLERIGKHSIPFTDALRAYAAYLDSLEVRYKKKIILVSDNPAFDISHIDYCMWRYLNRAPIRYTSEGVYRKINDPSERISQHKAWDCVEKELAEIVKHDHWAENDAKYIYYCQIFADRIKSYNPPVKTPFEGVLGDIRVDLKSSDREKANPLD